MLFRFSATPRGGLRVIPIIPNIDRCWLEGRNGIGKTVAVRLLELVAGKQPFSRDTAGWTALKENLGPTTITISEFPATADIQSIRVDLTPHQWPNHPAPLTTDLGSVFIDGDPSHHKTLRDYIDVFRIGGDETVVSQLRSLIATDHALAIRSRASLDDAAKQIADILTPLIIDLDRLSESDFEYAGKAVRQARQRVAAGNTQLKAISQNQRDLQELIELLELQEQQRLRGPRVQTALETTTSKVGELTARKDDLTHQLRALVPEHAASQQLQRELEKVQKRRDGRLARAARTQSTALQALQAAELEADTIATALQDAIQQRNELRKDRSALDVLPAVLEIIKTTRAPLAEVETSSLDAEIVAILDGSHRITASVLRSGLDARTEELKLHVAYDTLAEIDRHIRDNNVRIQRLKDAESMVRDVNRKAALLVEAEDQIQALTQQLRASTGNEYSRVSDQLRHVESELTTAIKREVECKVHLDLLNRSGGAPELDNKISDLQRKLDISSDEAHSELSDAVDLHRKLTAENQQHRFELAVREKTHRVLEEQLVRTVELVSRGADYQWLRDSVPAGHLPTVSTDRHAAIRQLTHLATAATSVQLNIEAALNQAATIQEALDSITRSIAMHQDPPRNPFVDDLIKWYEGQMAEYLSNQDIREAIFDGGEFRRFDLMNGFVVWRTTTGELRRRPIEAFSSGERAFAYMLAAILSHRESTAQYRVFVLDEFGAFVEQARRSRLWRFLDERLLNTGIATQVIVILPSQSSSPKDEQTERHSYDGYFAIEAPL